MAHADRQQQTETCTGTAERVVCVNVARPAFVIRPAFHVGMRQEAAARLHGAAWIATEVRPDTCKGMAGLGMGILVGLQQCPRWST